MLNIVKLFKMKHKMQENLFSEGIKLEQCSSTGRLTFMENEICMSHQRFCWFLRHLVPLSPLGLLDFRRNANNPFPGGNKFHL